ncbi:phosphatidate cytidylyltransferase [[Actinobacillus] muris]|uniref:Phosphatidate cytidylyltransferase n=1 Tax=Muribacter muris TaxID=67855 RepID=A0A0J5P958_9PAST|nr:phosphatidate cytidylyltransferase [Muribacter muris]KMK52079.1 phosphatidate cytidylyltransferase [[Actinobacillus] muris] [Muribacter muris]
MWSQINLIFFVVLLLLVGASVVGKLLKNKYGEENSTIANLVLRINAWWVMVSVLYIAFVCGRIGVTILFSFISFVALREFMTVIYQKCYDHSMVVCLYLLLPIQYYFVLVQWYGMFSIFIPVCGFLLLPIVGSLSGNTEQFLARTAKIQWIAMICIFCISHVPALLFLNLEGFQSENNILLVIFMLTTVQASDVLQYIWGKLIGGTKIMPGLSPTKTISGTVGGVISATFIAILMSPITPFSYWQAGLVGFIICIIGFLGGLVMSAIKRDYGVKDWGKMVSGHGGILDRMDSICFSAPIFFHILRYYWSG